MMSDPIALDIPHKLGRAKAREKIEQGSSQLASIVPGGKLTTHRWEGDRLHIVIEALGQRVGAQIEVFDSRVHTLIDLPPMAALFANGIKDKLLGVGTKLLR